MSGTHFIVYAARHGAKSFFEGISDPTFFATINRIFDDGYYKEYKDPRHGEVFCFETLRDFVTSPHGLDIPDWLPFMKALQAQDNGSAAKDLYWRMVKLDEMLSPDVSLVLPLHPAPSAGGASTNPTGRQGKERCDHGNVVPRGQSSEYRIARLKRDAPEIATALARGEYPSVRAAAMAAGFVPPSPPSLQLKDPAPTAQKLLVKMGKEWCDQFLDELEALMLEV
jgi:hypothetical protein